MTKTISRALLVLGALVAMAAAVAGCGTSGSSSTTATTTTLNPNAPQAQQWNPGDPTTDTDTTVTDETSTVTPASTLPPGQATVDRTDPAAVAKATLMIWYSWDTGSDSGPEAGIARATPLLSPDYAQTLINSGSSASDIDPNWLTWADQSAKVSADVSSPQPTAGAPGVQRYTFTVTQTARTREGAPVGAPIVRNVAVTCAPAGLNDWQVTEVAEQ